MCAVNGVDVAGGAPIALLEREPRIARLAQSLSDGKRDVAAREVARVALAKADPSHVPAGVGAEWRLEDSRFARPSVLGFRFKMSSR